MAEAKLTLYVDHKFLSPYALSAFVALEEKGLRYDLKPIDLHAGDSHKTTLRAVKSITGRVPTLVHDSFALAESSAIDEYVDESFPGAALYPKSKQDRARARQVQAWLRSDLMPLRQQRSTEVVFVAPTKTPLTDEGKAAVKKLFDACEELLQPGAKYMFGDWSIADTDLALMLNRLVLNGDEVTKRLADYAREQWGRPSVKKWIDLQKAAK